MKFKVFMPTPFGEDVIFIHVFSQSAELTMNHGSFDASKTPSDGFRDPVTGQSTTIESSSLYHNGDEIIIEAHSIAPFTFVGTIRLSEHGGAWGATVDVKDLDADLPIFTLIASRVEVAS